MAPRQCSMCSNSTTRLCKSCRCSPYCCTECQNADWPVHKLLCKHLPQFATPPKALARRGIFFPVDATTPVFVWVNIKWVDDDEREGFESIKQIELYIGDKVWNRIRISGNVIRSRERQDQLQIYMRDTALIDGSELNRSIARTLGGDAAFYGWCGGMLAMKEPTLQMNSLTYAHIDTVDFRDVVDLFRSYGSSVRMSEMGRNQRHKGPVSPIDEELKREAAATFQQPGSSKVSQPKVTPSKLKDLLGVRINSPRDCAGVGMFQAVKVTSNDPVWSALITTVSSRIGLPIRVRTHST